MKKAKNQTYIVTVERLFTSDFGDPECRRIVKTEVLQTETKWDALKECHKVAKDIVRDWFYMPDTTTSFNSYSVVITREYEGYPDYFTYGVAVNIQRLEPENDGSAILWAKMK